MQEPQFPSSFLPSFLSIDDMMQQNLTKETSLKILMVSSEYELTDLKKETLALIVKEVFFFYFCFVCFFLVKLVFHPFVNQAPEVLHRKDLRTVLSQWPWNLIDIIRALVKGEGAEFSEEDEPDNFLESEDEADEDEPAPPPPNTEMS